MIVILKIILWIIISSIIISKVFDFTISIQDKKIKNIYIEASLEIIILLIMIVVILFLGFLIVGVLK